MPEFWGGRSASRRFWGHSKSTTVPQGPTNTVAPAISGTPDIGEELTVSDGTWTGTGTITYAYQWKRDGVAISGETTNAYTLVAEDDGTDVSCTVTATDDNGSQSAASNAVSIAYPVSVSDQSAPFGADTVATQGRFVPLDDDGDPATVTAITGGTLAASYEIVDGGVARSSGTPTSDNGGTLVVTAGGASITLTISVVAGKSIATVSELSGAAEMASGYSGAGTTLRLRPGNYDTLAEFTGAKLFNGRFTGLSSPLTITSHDTDNKAVLNRWLFYHTSGTTGNVTFDNLDFYRPQQSFVDAGVAPTGSEIIAIGANVQSQNVAIRNCDLSSDIGFARLGATVTQEVRGIKVLSAGATGLTIEDNVFHNLVYGIAVRGTTISIERNEYYYLWADPHNIYPVNITGTDGVDLFDNVAHDFTGDGAQLHPDFLQCYIEGGTNGDIKNVRFRGNILYPGVETMRMPAATTPNKGITVTSDYTVPANTNTRICVDASAGPVTITLPARASHNGSTFNVRKEDQSANVVTVVPASGETIESGASWALNVPFKQVQLSGNTGTNWARNHVIPAVQGILCQGLGTGAYENWEIDGNVLYSNAVAGIRFEEDMENIHIHHNTILRPWPGDANLDGTSNDMDDGFAPYAAPMILLSGSIGSSTGVVIEDNVCDTVQNDSAGSPTITNNDTSQDRTSLASFTALFQGTTEADFYPATKAEALAAALAKSGGALDTGGIGALGTTTENGYYDFVAQEVNPTPTLEVEYLGKAEWTGTAATSHTFTSQPLGTASADRHILVTLEMRRDGGTTSATVLVAGVSATKVAEIIAPAVSGAAQICAHYIAAVPTGTTGDIIVGHANNLQRAAIGIYRLEAPNTTAVAVASGQNSAAGAISLNVNTIAGGAVIASANHADSGATDTVTFVGVTEDFDAAYAATTYWHAAGHHVVTASETPRTVSATCSGTALPATAVATSWQPA